MFFLIGIYAAFLYVYFYAAVVLFVAVIQSLNLIVSFSSSYFFFSTEQSGESISVTELFGKCGFGFNNFFTSAAEGIEVYSGLAFDEPYIVAIFDDASAAQPTVRITAAAIIILF